MKIAKLVDKIKENGLRIPENGSGRNGKVLARDLEATLGDCFAKLKYGSDPIAMQHLNMRRAMAPMKAYRYTDLREGYKKLIFEDNNGWVLEEKYNGWRMIITFVKGHGFMVWGGNISDVDFLPVDYTEHVLFNSVPAYKVVPIDVDYDFALDTEAIPTGNVQMENGLYSSGSLDTLKAILGCLPETSIEMQRTQAKLEFYCFDLVIFYSETKPNFSASNDVRVSALDITLRKLHSNSVVFDCFNKAVRVFKDKKERLKGIWQRMGEGAILKHKDSTYVPGGRLRTHAIKVKRSMSGEIGDDIDAFITGWVSTPEWEKKGLIGGLKLGVFIEEGGERKLHHIATVSSMPDDMRELLSMNPHGIACLKEEYMYKVLVVDGQELSSRTNRLMHAEVDWPRGFRQSKRAEDCTFNLKRIEETKF